MRRVISSALSLFKYVLAAFMIYAGAVTALSEPIAPLEGALGFLYSSKWFLVIMGTAFAVSGAILLFAKLFDSRKWIGRGLFLIYLCFLFSAGLNVGSEGTYHWEAWGPNLVASLITAILYLRWKYHILYTPTKVHYVDADGHVIRTEIKDERES